MGKMIAEYKIGKAVYQITEEGFVDNINPRLPNMEIVYPWHRIYAALEYEKERNPQTGTMENVVRWMRVYDKQDKRIVAQMGITNVLRESMFQFYRLFLETQDKAINGDDTLPNNVTGLRRNQ